MFELRAYIKYTVGREWRFVCLVCDRVETEGNCFVLYKNDNVIGQFDRAEVDVFYYTETEKGKTEI